MFGSHLEKDCWTKYPDKKPKFDTPKKKRGRERERTRSKSKEKEETRPQNKGRGNSPYPTRVGRVNERPLKDRDSDDSVGKESDPKEIERNYLEAKEVYDKQVSRARTFRF